MDEILVNTSIVGDQQASAIAGFRGTQYVVVWEDNGDAKIKGQMFAVNGNKTSSEFVVNLPGEPGTSRRLPAIVECGLGFAVAWIEKPRGAAAQVKLRTFDHDTLSGPEIQVSTAEVEALTAARDGASRRRGLRRRLGRQAARRAHPRAAFRILGREKRPRVSRQYHPRAAQGADGGLPDQRQYRDRVARALGRAPSRSPANIRLEWSGAGRRADNEPGRYGHYHGGARHRAVRHRPCEECIRRRNRLRNHRRASQRVRAERRFHRHPDFRLRRAANPVLLADARAVARWTLRAGLDAKQYGCPGGRQQCQGQGFFGKPKARSVRPSRSIPRPAASDSA